MPAHQATLYLVSTPIGNLEDITLRALRILKSVDLIACEDQRVTKILCNHYGINTKLISYHDHNAPKMRPKILADLEAGKNIALVSDAGTPLISDPGFKLVQEVRSAGFRVEPIPGASALLSALVASALPTDQFLFAGFLPPKSAARKTKLETLKTLHATLIFYETAPRLVDVLKDMKRVFGGTREVVIARELTKKFEEFITGSVDALILKLNNMDQLRGEIVLLVGPGDDADTKMSEEEVKALILKAMEKCSISDLSNDLSPLTGWSKKEIYQCALSLKKTR